MASTSRSTTKKAAGSAKAAKTTTRTKAKTSKPPVTDDAERFDDLPAGESERAFEAFLPHARARKGEVVAYRGGVLIALTNVRNGVTAVKPLEARIAAELPRIDRKALWALPELALGTAFAARAVQNETPAQSDLGGILARLYPLRELLLSNAEGLASAGLFKRADVDAIRAGSGKLDAAQDCVDLAALYRKNAAALRGKTPVTAKNIADAAELGAAALRLIKPRSARKATAPASTAATDRDQLFSLLVDHYNELRRVAMYFWLDDADRYVPPLLSRNLAGRPKKGSTPAKGPSTPTPAPA